MHEENTKTHWFFSVLVVLLLFYLFVVKQILTVRCSHYNAESEQIIDTYQFIAFYCMGSLYSFSRFEWLKCHPLQDLKSNHQIDSSDHL